MNESKSDKSGHNFSIRTITLRDGVAEENRREDLVERFTDVEIQARRNKRFYFQYDERIPVGPKCKVKKNPYWRRFAISMNAEKVKITKEDALEMNNEINSVGMEEEERPIV